MTSTLETFWDAAAAREAGREERNPRKRIHTDLLWREIYRTIREIQSQTSQPANITILDAGAGPGRFSLPLAQAGHWITHLDISNEMLNLARQAAHAQGIGSVQFIHGNIADLSQFADNTFDLTLCLDSPLSYVPDRIPATLAEFHRITRSTLILCVMNRLGIIAEGGIDFDLQYFGRLVTVPEVYTTGDLDVENELRDIRPSLMTNWHAFRPGELHHLLKQAGFQVKRLSAPGTLARFTDIERLRNLIQEQTAYQAYLDFAEEFDRQPEILGVGALGAGGLLATAFK